MAKHLHAESMTLYAQDAAETETPWERWEFCPGDIWIDLNYHPSWNLKLKYRRKQKTIKINGFEVPEPYRGKMEFGKVYWGISMFFGAVDFTFSGANYAVKAMQNGLVHLTEDAARKHAEALFSFTKQEN